MYDVIIAGGGISGMSAALVLGRCKRSVLLIDNNQPRNSVTKEVHGFLSRDGVDPVELRSIARSELSAYPSIEIIEDQVVDAEEADIFEVDTKSGKKFSGRFLVIATGIHDVLPEIDGIKNLYGVSVFHCPYCDGWENRDKALAVYGKDDEGVEFALELKNWSSDVLLCTDGEQLNEDQKRLLKLNDVAYQQKKISRFERTDGVLEAIVFANGKRIRRDVLFFYPEQYQKSPLADKLGLKQEGGQVMTGKFRETKDRVFVIGDAGKSVQLAVIAAAEGVEAAFAINTELQKMSIKR